MDDGDLNRRDNYGCLIFDDEDYEETEQVPEKDTPVSNLEILSPDNPLLEKFQQALKEQLLLQINHLKEEIWEYELDTKKKDEEREILGVQVYEAQQILCRQQKTLEQVILDLHNTNGAREELENIVEENKKKYKEEREKMLEAEKKCIETQSEIEAMSLLENQMSKWEEKIEGEIAVNQRMAEKTKIDNVRLAEEKRKQDMILYKLSKEIWRLEGELETMDMQLRVKESEREDMAQDVALGNTNIEAIEAEQRCLMHAWNSVIVAIGHRDKILSCLQEEQNKENERFKTVVKEIEQVKKLIKREMEENEKLTAIKHRIDHEMSISKNRYDEEWRKNSTLKNQVMNLQAIIDQTNKDIDSVVIEQRHKEAILTVVNKDYNQVANKKFGLEQEIMKLLDSLVTNDSVAHNLNKILKNLKNRNREQELKVSLVENETCQKIFEMEQEKFAFEENKKLSDFYNKQNGELEKESDTIKKENDRLLLLIRKKTGVLEFLTNKLQKGYLTEEADALDIKIKTLEKSLEETQEKIKLLQGYWLREQRYLLDVSKARQKQIYDKNLLKKQLLILEQKNLNITDELEQIKLRQGKIERNILKLENRVTILCDTLFKKKDKKNDLDRTTDFWKNQYEIRLKDAELECLKIEAEISEIESDKLHLSKDLIDLNRESLEWEKKVKMIRENKEKFRQELSSSGELGTMRAEVHRMSVRYSQLKKAQDKLIQDLDHCVTRRTNIYIGAEASIKKTGGDKTKINYSRKIDDVKNKIKLMENEIEKYKSKISAYTEEKAHVTLKTHQINKEIELLNENVKEIKQGIEISKTNRQLKFELLVIQQKRLNMYTDLCKNRKPYTVYRTEEQLTTEYNKNKEINNKLIIIFDNLTKDFPKYFHEFSRCLNTLKLVTYCCAGNLSCECK